MRKRVILTAAIVWCALAVPSGAARAAGGLLADDDDGPLFNLPELPGIPMPPGVRLGPDGRRSVPGVTTPLVPPAAKAPAAPERSRAEILDDLFGRLAAAGDSDEAQGLASRIERVWLQSGSDTADLLMSRAATVSVKGESGTALQLLDKVVALDPDWVEGWNRRATVRFLGNDDFGSMEDIVHVLTLEPRHFGALNGMAIILQRHGMKKDALTILRRAAAIYPHNTELQKQLDDLTPEVEGRPL